MNATDVQPTERFLRSIDSEGEILTAFNKLIGLIKAEMTSFDPDKDFEPDVNMRWFNRMCDEAPEIMRQEREYIVESIIIPLADNLGCMEELKKTVRRK